MNKKTASTPEPKITSMSIKGKKGSIQVRKNGSIRATGSFANDLFKALTGELKEGGK